jgi:galactonate dehydratase
MSAIAGIDQALWDIKGRACRTSVTQLLGGQVRNRIKVYSWIGGDRPAETAAAAQAAAAEGAEPYNLMFIEEPVLTENLDSFLDPLINTSTPIALGERLFSRSDFKSILASGAVDIIQPDPSHAGGISETRKIATMAEAYDVAVALHCPLGPIALASCLQIDGCTYNAFIQEQSLGIHYNVGNDLLDYLTDPSVFDYADGYVTIPTGPGLGIDVNEEYVTERSRVGHRWRNPIWRHADGSIAEWVTVGPLSYGEAERRRRG